jgi:hypothetical protein
MARQRANVTRTPFTKRIAAVTKRKIWLVVFAVVQVIAAMVIASRGLQQRSEQIVVGGLVIGTGVTTSVIYTEPRTARKDEDSDHPGQQGSQLT